MPNVALTALVALSAYATSFHSPGPALTRIAPDRVQPRQRPLSIGFWGASAELQVIGPDVAVLYGRNPLRFPTGYTVHNDFNAVLKHDRTQLYAELKDSHRRGFLRMVPSLWYGVRPEITDRLVGDGRAAASGRFFWFPTLRPRVLDGWRIVAERTYPIRLEVDYPNSGAMNGGIGVAIHEPAGWRLSDIGLDFGRSYDVDFDHAWENPLSTGTDPKLPDEEWASYEMFPEVWAEVTDATLENPATGVRRVTQTPTGWVEAAGRFQRRRT